MKAENRDVDVAQNDATPSVETTMRFLGVVRSVWFSRGRGRQGCAGPAGWGAGLPGGDDWPACNAVEMRAVVEYLQEAGAAVTESGTPRR